MIEVKRKRRVDLHKRKMRMLKLDFIRAPTAREMDQRDFDYLDVGVVNPRPSFGVPVNVACRFNDIHGFLSSSTPAYSALG